MNVVLTSSACMGICIMFSETMGVVTSVWRLQPSVKNSDPSSGILLNLPEEEKCQSSTRFST